MSVLSSIIDGVREDLSGRRSLISLDEMRRRAAEQAPALSAYDALTSRGPEQMHVIAEVKRKSPSKGALADIPEPAELAAAYQAGGASVISVLTEQRRFGGSLADLDAVRTAVTIPVLRKDFMVDEYQFYEARAHGADLVLLIVAALDDHELRDFLQLTRELGMQALVETHTVEEIERAAQLDARIVGVNVRNLKTLEVDNANFSRLSAHLPQGVLRVAESGVSSLADVQEYAAHGAHAVLVGEALVKDRDPAGTVASFTSVPVTAA